MSNKVTIFKNIRETETPFFKSIDFILNRIKEGSSASLVKRIRKEKDKAHRNDLKRQLPAICFSGEFNKRADSSLVNHSGYICLDFDGYKKQKDLLQDKEKFQKNKFVLSVFISPSGLGLKVIIKIPQDPDNHKKYFNSLEKEFNSEYFDKTTKNVSRVCYESYDPLIYINTNSLVWNLMEEDEYKEVHARKDVPTIPISDENKIVEILLKWFTNKYPMVEGVRNENLFKLAMAFNDFGVNRSLAEHICLQYQSRDFKASEIKTTINSAYSNTKNFGSKYYEDTEKINEITQRLRRGEAKKNIRQHLEESMLESEVIDSILDKAEAESEDKFWSKSDKGVIKAVPILFKKFLEDNGYYKYCPEGSRNYVFVKVTNNLIDHTSEKEIKDFVLGYLEKIEDLTIYNYFADQTRIFKEEFLTLLGTIDIFFSEDTSTSSYLYFKNCAVRISKDEVEAIDYVDLNGYVWKDHVIDRMYKKCDSTECDYRTFINNICAKNPDRTLTMESTIGFLMHGHKNLSYCPAVILNDEQISDNPEGGTGKGIFFNALGHMKKLVTIDGKAFNFEKSFAYQLVSADTQILCFDDVKKYFEFERLFSVVTEGLTLEKKNKDAIKIPFAKSPKIAITTNYAIKGHGNSFARRKWELELNQHYNKNHTPLDEFGRLLFGDWDDQEWCKFDGYMIWCLQLYLKKGLIKSEFVNLKIRVLSAETSHEFIEWCGLIKGMQPNSKLKPKTKLYKNDLYFDFIEEYPDYGPKAKMTISRMRFYKWINAYCIFKYNIAPDEGRDGAGKWLIIKTHQGYGEQTNVDF